MSLTLITKILTNQDGTFARVLLDAEGEEFTVKFYRGGKFLKDANYYTEDESDAKGTAQLELSRMAGVTVVHPLD